MCAAVFSHIFFLFHRAPNNDYSPETLQTVNDVVYLNLFDEVVFNILQVRCQELHVLSTVFSCWFSFNSQYICIGSLGEGVSVLFVFFLVLIVFSLCYTVFQI